MEMIVIIANDEILLALLKYQWAKRAETEVEISTIINRRNNKILF